jgi:hypothetical protein
MAKRLFVLFCVLMLVLCLLGCVQQNKAPSSPIATRPAGAIAQDATSPFIQQIVASMPQADHAPLEDAVLAENDEYVYYRKDGQCYLSFKSGNTHLNYTHEELKEGDLAGTIFFQESQELLSWLQKPQMNEKYLAFIQHSIPLHEEYGFLMPDAQVLMAPELPKGYSLKCAEIGPYGYGFEFKSSFRLPSGRYGGGWFEVISQQRFASKLAYYYRYARGHAAYGKTYTLQENGANVYETVGQYRTTRYIQYCLESEGRILFIEECRYDSSGGKKPIVNELSSVDIFGCENGVYFTVRVHYTDPDQLLALAKNMKLVPFAGQ